MLNRRQFNLGLAASSLPLGLQAARKPHIVVVGAGAGGLAFVQHLQHLLSPTRYRLSMVEPQSHYHPPFGHHRMLSGQSTRNRFAYRRALTNAWHQAHVSAVQPKRQVLQLSHGLALRYDYLVLSPGVSNRDRGQQTLAWFNDASATTLLHRLDTLPANAELLMTLPQLPYRCPPGPYERASLILSYLQRRGREDVHLTLLDSKESFSMQAHFMTYWEQHWPGRIDWLPPSVHAGIRSISENGVNTELDQFRADLVLALHPQQAPSFCQESGLANFTGYCPVSLPNMRSRKYEKVYVLGDAAAAGDMPKSASAAVSQAAHAAYDMALRLGAKNTTPRPEALHSRCYSRFANGLAVSSKSRFSRQGVRLEERLSPYPLDKKKAAAEYAAAELWFDETIAGLGLRN